MLTLRAPSPRTGQSTRHTGVLTKCCLNERMLKNKEQISVKIDGIFIQVMKQKRRRWGEMEGQIKTNYWDPLGYSSLKRCTSTWLHPSCKLFLVNFIDGLLIMPTPRVLLGKQPKTQSCYRFSRTPHHNSAWPTALTSLLVPQLLPSPWL